MERVIDAFRTLIINLLFIALVLVVGYSLIITYRLKQHETWQKTVEVNRAHDQLTHDIEINDGLKREIQFLRTEPGVEKIARERLGLIRPNETTYLVINARPPHPHHAHPTTPLTGEEEPPSEPILTQAWHLVVDLWNGGE